MTYWQSLTVLPVDPGQYYTLLGYLQTDHVVAGSGGGGARLLIYFFDASGTEVDSYATPLVTQTSAWTKYVMPFTPPANTATVQVWLKLYNAQGTAKFDNIRLSPGKLATTAAYDSLNNDVTSTSDPLGNTTSYQNDPYGQPTQVSAADGSQRNFSYDGEERLRTVTDNAGNITTYDLDANGNVLSDSLASGAANYDSESFTYDRENNLTSETDADIGRNKCHWRRAKTVVGICLTERDEPIPLLQPQRSTQPLTTQTAIYQAPHCDTICPRGMIILFQKFQSK